MSRFLSTLTAFAVVSAGAPISGASAQSWSWEYLPADEAGEVSVCTAGIEYNNAAFLIRVYDSQIDFLFYRDDFTLPWGTELGTLIFEIDGRPFQLAASTFSRGAEDKSATTRLMQILPYNEDVGDLLDMLSWGNQLEIVFPNDDVYPTSLVGSSNAISSMAQCYELNETGLLENNPFSGSGVAPGGSNNPFQ